MDIRGFFGGTKNQIQSAQPATTAQPLNQPTARPKMVRIGEHKQKELQKLLSTHKEYTPEHSIPDVLKIAFPSTEIIHSYKPNHKIIKIQIKDFLDAPIDNWQYNRPPDLIRCSDIAKSIYKLKQPVDTMFYISYNNNTHRIDILDGIHRYTALKLLKTENSKQIDLITPSEYGSNNDANHIYESYIIINIRFNATQGELIDCFQTLNKSSPVPDLYLRDPLQAKREVIENIAKTWQQKYKSHFSTNQKPNKPNINRDRFIDILCELYDKYNITEENQQILEQMIDSTNTYISLNIPKKLSSSVVKKCMDTGCWLFVYSADEIIDMVC